MKKVAMFLFVYMSFGQFVQGQTTKKLADSLHRQVIKLSRAGDKDSALILAERVIRMRKELESDFHYVRIHVDKIEIQRSMTDINGALSTINTIEPFLLKTDTTPIWADFYNRKAAVVYELEDVEAALLAIHKSQQISEFLNDSINRLSNLSIEGACYRELKEYRKAIKTLKRQNTYAKRDNRVNELCMSDYNLTQVYFNLNKPDSALIYINEFLKNDHRQVGSQIYEYMLQYKARAYHEMGKHAMAYVYLDSLHEIRMKAMAKLNAEVLEETKSKHKSVLLEYENELLTAKNDRNQLVILFAILSAIGIALGLTLRQLRLKKYGKQQEKLNENLTASVAFKNRLLAILAHDIKNPINGLNGVLSLYKEKVIGKEEFKTLIAKLEGSTKNVSLLIENILNWIKVQGDDFDVVKRDFAIAELLANVTAQTQAMLEQKGIQVDLDIKNPESSLNADFDIVTLIMRNILSNAIKFSNENGKIDMIYLDSVQTDEHILMVRDYGLGMNSEQLKAINVSSKSTKGTKSEGGTGIGLKLCFDMIELVHGKIEIDSTQGEGTTVRVHLPK